MTEQLFSTKEAAEYLGVSVSTVRYHIYEIKTLKGQRVGNSLVFTKEVLDEFKKNKRPARRPRKDEK